MRAYELHGVNDLRREDIEKPEIPSGWVLVQVKASGICSSDIPRIFTNGTYHFPTIPGHEFSGVVAAYGEGVPEERVGKRVGIFPLIPCRTCRSAGRKNMRCANTTITSLAPGRRLCGIRSRAGLEPDGAAGKRQLPRGSNAGAALCGASCGETKRCEAGRYRSSDRNGHDRFCSGSVGESARRRNRFCDWTGRSKNVRSQNRSRASHM